MLNPEQVTAAFAKVGVIPANDEPPQYETPPLDAYEGDAELERAVDAGTPAKAPQPPQAACLQIITPAAWKDTETPPLRWLAAGRIPADDLTIFSGNGGSGKTELSAALCVSVAAGLGDWVGACVETGPVLFLSAEEPEANVRDRIERIAKHRSIDPHAIADLHLTFPDLESTWLVTTDANQRLVKTPMFIEIESWIRANRPVLWCIDSIAAVFDGDAISRRQVRRFLAILRKLALECGTAIVLLDHPSVRGMADGSGTANSVDWRNSVRSMMHLSDPPKDEPDVRELELKKTNRGRMGEKVRLRWAGLTFSTDGDVASAPHRAAEERKAEDAFLRLLVERNTQGRWVTPNKASGYAPKELAAMPTAAGFTAAALANAMERLLANHVIVVEEFGPPSKRRQRLIVGASNRLPTGA
jgi:RecA-family ATPase